MIRTALAAIALMACSTAQVYAQNDASSNNEESNATKQPEFLALQAPESVAFAALGASPSDVTRPTSLQDFAIALANGVGRNGEFQTGVAIEFSPNSFFPLTRNLREYNNDLFKRLTSRMGVTLATTQEANDRDDVQLAVGLNWTPIDFGDRLRVKPEGVGIGAAARAYNQCLIDHVQTRDSNRYFNVKVNDDSSGFYPFDTAGSNPLWTIAEDENGNKLIKQIEVEGFPIEKFVLKYLGPNENEDEFLVVYGFRANETVLGRRDDDAIGSNNDLSSALRNDNSVILSDLSDFLQGVKKRKGVDDLSDDHIKELRSFAIFNSAAVQAQKKCFQIYETQSWNATRLQLAVAPIFTDALDEGGVDEGFRYDGFYGAVTFAYGFDLFGEGSTLQDNVQFLLHARYRDNEVVTPEQSEAAQMLGMDEVMTDMSPAMDMVTDMMAADLTPFRRDVYALGGRLIIADPRSNYEFNDRRTPNWYLYGEGLFEHANNNGRDNDDSVRWSVGLDLKLPFQISNNPLWIGLSGGSTVGRDEMMGGDNVFVLSQLRVSFGANSSIGQQSGANGS